MTDYRALVIGATGAVGSALVREPAAGCEAAFCTMGVGQPRKVPREVFWSVDVEYATAFARACRDAGVRHMSLLGALGANPRSSNYYLRVQGAVVSRGPCA